LDAFGLTDYGALPLVTFNARFGRFLLDYTAQ
jgi:hypothetical protein